MQKKHSLWTLVIVIFPPLTQYCLLTQESICTKQFQGESKNDKIRCCKDIYIQNRNPNNVRILYVSNIHRFMRKRNDYQLPLSSDDLRNTIWNKIYVYATDIGSQYGSWNCNDVIQHCNRFTYRRIYSPLEIDRCLVLHST